jgi:uroporphyrinogen-III decarboxylase
VSWRFDRSDMAKAKQVLGAECCIEGNIPSSMLVAGTPEQVAAHAGSHTGRFLAAHLKT